MTGIRSLFGIHIIILLIATLLITSMGFAGPPRGSRESSTDEAITAVEEVAGTIRMNPDSDLDGVIDSLDLCLDTPEKIIVSKSGCPDTSAILTKRIMPGLFPSGGSTLKYADPTQLDSIVAFLTYFDNVTVIIYGHTDNLGLDEANLLVSQERASAVQEYFVRRGISEDRILSIGKGEMEPIASNRTRSGRRMNRRIEIEFRRVLNE